MGPYQIITKIIEWTEPFRRLLRERAEQSGDQRLRELAQMVWIFPARNTTGVSDYLPESNMQDQAHKYLDAMFAHANVKRENEKPLKYRFSQGRDIWGLFVYHKSGFNHLLTAQALGHSTLTSLLHYLEKRTLKIKDRLRLIALQGKVITDLRVGNFNPRVYREKPMVRASTGLTCADPTHPEPEADPGNPGGHICRSQGCWACFNWYATVESLPYLLRMIQDLKELREVMAVALWETSDYPFMLAVYEYIVSKFHRDHVAKAETVAFTMPPIITTTQFTTSGRVVA
jgi:hypothetical protein